MGPGQGVPYRRYPGRQAVPRRANWRRRHRISRSFVLQSSLLSDTGCQPDARAPGRLRNKLINIAGRLLQQQRALCLRRIISVSAICEIKVAASTSHQRRTAAERTQLLKLSAPYSTYFDPLCTCCTKLYVQQSCTNV